MKEKREKRLEKEFQKIIYEIITLRLKNPEISEMFSISSVEVTSDLENANVYVSVFSSSNALADRTFSAIQSSSGEIRKILSKEMRIRTVPKLHFLKDTSAEYGDRIDKIISSFTYGENNDDN